MHYAAAAIMLRSRLLRRFFLCHGHAMLPYAYAIADYAATMLLLVAAQAVPAGSGIKICASAQAKQEAAQEGSR